MSKPNVSPKKILPMFRYVLSQLQAENRKTLFKRLKRYTKLQYLKLLRSPGGGNIVALGFAIGFGLEMILPITFYTAYILMVPLIRYKNLISSAIIGNIFGKISFFPILFIPFGYRLGHHLFFHLLRHLKHHTIWHNILSYFATIIGLSLCGFILGSVCYAIVYFLYELNKKNRLAKRKLVLRNKTI